MTAVDLAQCGIAVRLIAPELLDVEPLSPIFFSEDLSVVRTVEGSVFQFARNERGVEAMNVQMRLLPFLHGHVEVVIPKPTWMSERCQGAPFGLWGHEELPGIPLCIEMMKEQSVEKIADSIANFLLSIHRFSVEHAHGLGVPTARMWKGRFEEMGNKGLLVLRNELRFTEFMRLRRWWRRFISDNRNWKFDPVLVHGDLKLSDLLVDSEQKELVAVGGFTDVSLGDPAVDFQGLVRCVGAEFSWRVVDAYRHRGGVVDADMFRRVRLFGTAMAICVAARFEQINDSTGVAAVVAELRERRVLEGGHKV